MQKGQKIDNLYLVSLLSLTLTQTYHRHSSVRLTGKWTQNGCHQFKLCCLLCLSEKLTMLVWHFDLYFKPSMSCLATAYLRTESVQKSISLQAISYEIAYWLIGFDITSGLGTKFKLLWRNCRIFFTPSYQAPRL